MGERPDDGVSLLGQLIGAETARAFRNDREPYERALREAVVDYGYGSVWSSDVLDLRTRSSTPASRPLWTAPASCAAPWRADDPRH